MNYRIQEGQCHISDLLVQQEEAMRDLYKTYAKHIPRTADFWNEMALEEAAHADILRTLRAHFLKKDVAARPGVFKTEAVKTNIEFLRGQRVATLQSGTTPITALSIALSMEESIIENRFFTMFEPATSAMVKEFEELQAHTLDHLTKLKGMWEAERLRMISAESRTTAVA